MGSYIGEKLGACMWMTGLPASGKTTIAHKAIEILRSWQCPVVLLDGDDIRRGLSAGLGYSDANRTEHMRRVAEVAALLVNQGFAVICSVVSPRNAHREYARRVIPDGRMHVAYVKCPLAVCEARDPKHLYALANRWGAPEYITIYTEYELPSDPDLTLDSNAESADSLAAVVAAKLYAEWR